jgi:TonB family protein
MDHKGFAPAGGAAAPSDDAALPRRVCFDPLANLQTSSYPARMMRFSPAATQSILCCTLAASFLVIASTAAALTDAPYLSPLPKGSRAIADDEGRFVKCLPPQIGAPSNFPDLCAKFLDDMKRVRVAHPLKPIYKEDWITAEDYPQALRGSGTAGRAIIQVNIAAKGQLVSCSVVDSSGSGELDRAACDTTMRKAKFAARIGRDGIAESSTYSRAVIWKPVK